MAHSTVSGLTTNVYSAVGPHLSLMWTPTCTMGLPFAVSFRRHSLSLSFRYVAVLAHLLACVIILWRSCRPFPLAPHSALRMALPLALPACLWRMRVPSAVLPPPCCWVRGSLSGLIPCSSSGSSVSFVFGCSLLSLRLLRDRVASFGLASLSSSFPSSIFRTIFSLSFLPIIQPYQSSLHHVFLSPLIVLSHSLSNRSGDAEGGV